MGTRNSRDSPAGQRQLRRRWSRAAASSMVCPLEVRISTEDGTPLDSTVTSNTTVPSMRAERAAEGYAGAGNLPPPTAENGTGWEAPPGAPPGRPGPAVAEGFFAEMLAAAEGDFGFGPATGTGTGAEGLFSG